MSSLRFFLLLLYVVAYCLGSISTVHAQPQQKYWIYLADKNTHVCHYDPKACLLEPIDSVMVHEIKATGLRIDTESRWLNAVSVYGSMSDLHKIVSHPGVQSVEPVQYFKKSTLTAHVHTHVFEPPQTMLTFMQPQNRAYGGSFDQLAFHNIDDVHAMGYFGKGVIVGIMDGGFDIQHPVFEHLRTTKRILAERDFVDGGTNTKVNVKYSSYHSHGTSVAGIIAGLKDSTLMGVAPSVSLVIARTEDDEREAPIEEDNWVQAIEWMQTLGVKVINTSLGYSVFDSQPTASYTYQQMNGRTSAIAKAALKAATVFNMVIAVSAGNEGSSSWKYITTPADADSILSVGSLNNLGQRVSSSSMGPTADGRIKPEVMARGACVYSSTSSSGHGYASCLNGTSFASPMVAGMMALAMQARPGMPAHFYVQKAKQASSQFNKPDNLNGYGTLDALKLIQLVLATTSLHEVPHQHSDAFVISNYPNPFNPATTIEIQKPDGWKISSVSIYDLLGRQVHSFQINQSTGHFYWNVQDQQQFDLSSGIYLVNVKFIRGMESVSRVHRISMIK